MQYSQHGFPYVEIMTEEFLYLRTRQHSPFLIPRYGGLANLPAQHGILPIPRLRILHIRPIGQKIPMAHDLGQLVGDDTVDIFHSCKVCREEDVEVAL